jgi:hypothetical protein
MQLSQHTKVLCKGIASAICRSVYQATTNSSTARKLLPPFTWTFGAKHMPSAMILRTNQALMTRRSGRAVTESIHVPITLSQNRLHTSIVLLWIFVDSLASVLMDCNAYV